jgi:spoIIIJ-associated protein
VNESETAVAPATAAPAWRSTESTGETVEAAIAAGLAELGIAGENAVVEVLARPMQALPGETVSGGGLARVRVTEVDPRTAKARARLEELLAKMGIAATVTVRSNTGTATQPPVLDISGDDLGLLIGWRGETLRALQTVVNLMMGDDDHETGRRIILDVERYRARREEQVKDMALRLANRVKRSGQRYTLDPMHAYERRAIHLALSDDSDVRTESSGKEPARRVVIHPTGPAQPDLPEYPSARFGGGDRERGGYGRGRGGGRGGDRGGDRGGAQRERW